MTSSVFESDPARLLPQLLEQMVALGEVARHLSQALGGNGHWPGKGKKLINDLLTDTPEADDDY